MFTAKADNNQTTAMVPAPESVSKLVPAVITGLVLIITGLLILAINSRSPSATPAAPASDKTFLEPYVSKVASDQYQQSRSDALLKSSVGFRPLPETPTFLKRGHFAQKQADRLPEKVEAQKLERLTRALESKTAIFLPGTYTEMASEPEPVAKTPEVAGNLGATMQAIEQARQKEIAQLLRSQADPDASPDETAYVENNQEIGYLNARRTRRLAHYELKAGRLINATLLTGINTALPGHVVAITNTPVVDSVTGQRVLIPLGAILFGSYSAETALGQNRLLIGFHRVEFPDGSTLQLGTMQAVDALGQTGTRAKTNSRFFQALAGATGLALVSAAVQLTQPEGSGRVNDARQTLAAELGRQWSDVSIDLIDRILSIQPVLTMKPGRHLHVMLTKDILLPPYRDWPALSSETR